MNSVEKSCCKTGDPTTVHVSILPTQLVYCPYDRLRESRSRSLGKKEENPQIHSKTLIRVALAFYQFLTQVHTVRSSSAD